MTQAEPLEITPFELNERMASNAPPLVIDVREAWEREIASIDGSAWIPLGAISSRFSEVPRDVPVAIICHHGGRSASAVAWLRGQGLTNVMNVKGGIDAWARLINPKLQLY